MAWTQKGKAVTLRIPENLWNRLESIWETDRYNHMKQGEFIKQLLSEYAKIVETNRSTTEESAVNHFQKKGSIRQRNGTVIPFSVYRYKYIKN